MHMQWICYKFFCLFVCLFFVFFFGLLYLLLDLYFCHTKEYNLILFSVALSFNKELHTHAAPDHFPPVVH